MEGVTQPWNLRSRKLPLATVSQPTLPAQAASPTENKETEIADYNHSNQGPNWLPTAVTSRLYPLWYEQFIPTLGVGNGRENPSILTD